MKKVILLAVFVLSMGTANAQIFILGDASIPSVGAMIHLQADVDRLGFYNYLTYGKNSDDINGWNLINFGIGASYYFSKTNDPQNCLRFYLGANQNVFWKDDDIIYPPRTYEISFDIAVSKTLGDFTMMIMVDPLNQSYKPGISYYF